LIVVSDASARAVGTYVRAARTDAAATKTMPFFLRPCDGDGRWPTRIPRRLRWQPSSRTPRSLPSSWS